jgi:hypothetical protein
MEDLMVLERIVSETRRWFALTDTYGKILRETEEDLNELARIIAELKELVGSNKKIIKGD